MAEKSSQELFRITPVYERLLIGSQKLPYGGIHHLHMLRADQFCRLYYSPKSVKHVQALLKDLVDHNYLQEEWPPTRLLRSKYIYVLGQESKAYLKEKDYHISDTLWSSVEIGRSSSCITHFLELNDVLISAMVLQQKAPLYSLNSLIHAREFKRCPCNITWRGMRLEIILDAFLDFHTVQDDGSKRRMPILLEHDHGNEFGEGFRKKIRDLIAFVKLGACKEHFKVDSIAIAFTTFEGEKRRDSMREVVRQELGSELKTLGNYFVFTNQPQPPDPKHMWLDPCWHTPYMEDKPVAVL